MKKILLVIAAAATFAGTSLAQEALRFESSLGEVALTPLGHASLRIEVNDVVIHVDPWSNVADYSQQPDPQLLADILADTEIDVRVLELP